MSHLWSLYSVRMREGLAIDLPLAENLALKLPRDEVAGTVQIDAGREPVRRELLGRSIPVEYGTVLIHTTSMRVHLQYQRVLSVVDA